MGILYCLQVVKDFLEQSVNRVTEEPRAHKGLKDQQVIRDHKARQDQQELQAIEDNLAHLVPTAHQDPTASRDRVDQLVQPERKDLPDHRARLVRTALSDQSVQRGQQAALVSLVSLVQQGHRDLPETEA